MKGLKTIIAVIAVLAILLIAFFLIKSPQISQTQVIFNDKVNYSLEYSPAVFQRATIDQDPKNHGLLSFSNNITNNEPYINVMYLTSTGINKQFKISSLVEFERKTIQDLGGNISKDEERKIGLLSGTILESPDRRIYAFIAVNEKDETLTFEMIMPKGNLDKQKYVNEFYSIISSYRST